MASWRFFFLEVSSTDQIEHLAEILFGVEWDFVTIARETKSLLARVILPSESSFKLRSQIRTLSQLQEQESCQKASSGTLNKHTPARKKTRDAAERIIVAVNLKQHRRQQLLRGNGCEWFLERGYRFCSKTLLQQNVVS